MFFQAPKQSELDLSIFTNRPVPIIFVPSGTGRGGGAEGRGVKLNNKDDYFFLILSTNNVIISVI